MIHPRQWMSFYSYIFKPSDFIKGYCFNLSWMDECTHWWNTGEKWGPHSLKWPQPISLSFSNMFSDSVFHMQSKTAWRIWSFWHNVFYSSVSEETESCLPPPRDKRMAVETSSLGGKKWDVTVREAQSRESWRRDKNVSIHANWCPDPPPGCRCLLSGERIKGPFTKHKDFHFFSTQSLSPFSCCF